MFNTVRIIIPTLRKTVGRITLNLEQLLDPYEVFQFLSQGFRSISQNRRSDRFEFLNRITWHPSIAYFKMATVVMEIIQLQNANEDDLFTARQNCMIFHGNSPKNRWNLINQKIGICSTNAGAVALETHKSVF